MTQSSIVLLFTFLTHVFRAPVLDGIKLQLSILKINTTDTLSQTNSINK